jgi:ribonuclease HI
VGSKKDLCAYINGTSRGNPGQASIGVIIYDSANLESCTSKCIGIAAMDEAAYHALLFTLRYAVVAHAESLCVYSDSKPVVMQIREGMSGQNESLASLYKQAKLLADQIPFFRIEYCPPELNLKVDSLVNDALNKQEARMRREKAAKDALEKQEIVAGKALAKQETLAAAALSKQEQLEKETLEKKEALAAEALRKQETLAKEALAKQEALAKEALASQDALAKETLQKKEVLAAEALAKQEELAREVLKKQEALAAEALARQIRLDNGDD